MPLKKIVCLYRRAGNAIVVCSIFVSGAVVSLKEKQKPMPIDLQECYFSAGFEGVDTTTITPEQIDNLFKSPDGQRSLQNIQIFLSTSFIKP